MNRTKNFMKKNRQSSFRTRFLHGLTILTLPLLLFLAGCKQYPDETTPATPTPISSDNTTGGTAPLPDEDNPPMTEEVRQNYIDSVLASLSITKREDRLSATHTNLLSTVVTITLYDSMDEDILEGCFSLIADYETRLSRTMKGSEIYCLNHSASGTHTVSKDTADLISSALSYGTFSNGALNVAIAPVSSLWTFQRGLGHRPSQEQITEQLAYIDHTKVTVEGETVSFANANMGLELGAVSKGYIADRVKDYLFANGVNSALIYLGGNTLLVGSKPDNTPFRVGIQMPFASSGDIVGILSAEDISIVSSGVYEKYFTEGDNFYHHILDSKTGYPVDTNLLEVTILSPRSIDGDALSTLCFAYGTEEGLRLINDLPDTYAMFITGTFYPATGEVDQLQLHYSDGFLEYSGFQPE